MADTKSHDRSLQRELLAWYEVEARDLPWRQTSNPYAIWISEVMLQQTQVETVLAYYARFLGRFPTVRALASASLDSVLKAWEGLGYYRRAHNLLRAARSVVSEHGGELPRTVEALRALPGIGPYTASAIASIAFGLDAPVLDGNVARVLSRIRRIDGDPGRAAVRETLHQAAAALLPPGDASRFNQALMDLGARICRPRSPRCPACPIAAHCDAHHTGAELAYPAKRPRRPVPHVDVAAGIVWDAAPFSSGARCLIAKRSENDMLGGLWEFPGGRVEEGETFEAALVRELQEELAIDVNVLGPFMRLNHAYTHFHMALRVFHCRHTAGKPRASDCADWAWVQTSDLDTYAFSTADRQVANELRRFEANRAQPRALHPRPRRKTPAT